MDLEDELFALRYQWSEMLENSAMEKSPDETARLVLRACVTVSKGLYDKMQHTVITPKGKERRVDIECLALQEGLETCSTKFFFVYTAEHNWVTVLPKTQRRKFASFLRNAQRWSDIWHTVCVFEEMWGCWDQYTGKTK